MAIRPVRLLGDPILRTRCEPVKRVRSPAVRVVADDLQDTLQSLKQRHGFGRGLAASQIGAPIRVIYLETDKPWFLINPEIVDVGTHDFLVWDDCFSIPGLVVRVQRAYHIKVSYLDMAGHTQVIEADGELAELLQHEIDHLDGVLIVDRPSGLDPFCFREEWEKLYEATDRYGPPALRAEITAEQFSPIAH
jgi:peptide deformylase